MAGVVGCYGLVGDLFWFGYVIVATARTRHFVGNLQGLNSCTEAYKPCRKMQAPSQRLRTPAATCSLRAVCHAQ